MWILEQLFPRYCIKCGKLGDYLCAECKKTLVPHSELCPGCHQRSKDFKTCPSCVFSGKRYLDGLIVGFGYEKWLKKLILKLKFYHKRDIATFLSERLQYHILINQYLSLPQKKEKLIISWIPSHWTRNYFEKGYNQSQILAKNLAKILKLPLLQLGKKTQKTRSQVSLNRNQRFSNLKHVFTLQNVDSLPPEATILLVDDVTTTGATLNEFAQTLKHKRPDLEVRGIVIARHT